MPACARCSPSLAQWHPPLPVRGTALSPDRQSFLTEEGSLSKLLGVAGLVSSPCFSKSCNTLHYSWKLCPWHWGIPAGILLSFERRDYHIIWYLTKVNFPKEKIPSSNTWRFFPFFPFFLSCTLYSLRSLDSLITAVVIIIHLYFCRAPLRSWEPFINTSSLIVPAALHAKGSYCPQRLGLQGSLGWGCRCWVPGAWLPGVLCGRAICLRHWRLKGFLVPGFKGIKLCCSSKVPKSEASAWYSPRPYPQGWSSSQFCKFFPLLTPAPMWSLNFTFAGNLSSMPLLGFCLAL